MTTQEAIEIITNVVQGDGTQVTVEQDEALAIVQRATKMREARKPKYYKYEGGGYECPNCYELLLEEHDRYCSNCGQAIDWSELDEIKTSN